MDEARIVDCEISSAAMDELTRSRGTTPIERETQFLELRDTIERMASSALDEAPTPSDAKVRIFYYHARHDSSR
jgi:Protein of unknown function (DUF1488)